MIIKSNQRQQTAQHYLSRGFQSSVEPGLWFGLGETAKIDTLEVTWPDKKKEIITNVQGNSTLKLSYAQVTTTSPLPKETVHPLYSETSALVFDSIPVHRENEFDDFDIEILLHRKLSEEGPQLVEGDVNDDGLVDFLILGAANQTNRLYVQQSNNTFQYSHQPEFVSDQELESTCAAFFDADGDSDLDLLVGHGGNEGQKGIENFYFRYYDNDGAGNFTPNVAKTPPGGGNVSVIKPNDFDKDGDVDLFIGGRAVPGHYGLIPRSFLLQNQGDGTWVDITTQTIGQLGMVTAATWADIDSDQDMDLLVVGEWMPVTILENTGNSFTKKIVEGSNGWWSALEKADLDGDGDLDFVLGNWGNNSKFRASPEKPLTLYTSDYDNNGKVESILEWYPPHSSTAYPFATKADITSQLPFLKKKVLKYEDYAKSTFSALFTNRKKESISSLEVTYLESAILWNDLTSYRLEALPQEAQVAPVYSIVADYLDDDDHVDLLLMGNMCSLKPEVGRLDANRGVLLKGLGVKGFLPLTTQTSGFWLKGQVRDAMVIPLSEERKRIIVARNNLPVSVYDKIVFSSL